jgi:hypothetical protein
VSSRDGVDTGALELVRWGLRFRNAATEADYQRWNVRGALPMFRACGLLAIVVIAAGIPMIRASWPATWARAATLDLIGALALAVAIAHSYSARPRHIRAIQVGAFLLEGMTNVTAVSWYIESSRVPGGACAVGAQHMLLVATLLRWGPALTMVEALPLAVFTEAFYVRRFLAGGLDAQLLLTYSAATVNCLVLALLISAAIDRRLRQSYREQRIIELQRQVIDRLQHSELRRQVAERAGRLAAALARTS